MGLEKDAGNSTIHTRQVHKCEKSNRRKFWWPARVPHSRSYPKVQKE
jgi:hypothetical protein